MRRRLSPESENTLVMTRGFEKCIFMYPLDQWAKEEAKLERLDMFQRQERAFLRMSTMWLHEETLDAQGRISLSRPLLDYAGIQVGERVAILGVRDHIEVWNPSNLDGYFEALAMDYEELAEEMITKRAQPS
jgi:MraZ protein